MRLNPEQQAAVLHPGHCVVVACPGSGKTRVLIEKAAHILETEPLATLVIVTFTRDAAREVRARLLLRLPGEMHRVRAETFHALAIRHCFEAGLFRQLVSPGQQASLLRRAWNHACPELAWDVFVRAVDWRASGHTAAPPCASFDDAFAHYLGLLEQHAAVDFGQVIVQSVQRIRDGSLARVACDYLMVDEGQDLDAVQLEWTFAHAERGACTILVGDDDQAVYGFRGSLGYVAMQRTVRHLGASLLTLETNYRSNSEILGLANRLIRVNADRVAKRLQAHRGPGGRVTLLACDDSAVESERIVELVRQRPDDWAVLARTNRKLDDIEQAFVRSGVRYARPGRANFWESEGPSLLLALLDSPHAPQHFTLSAALAHAGVPEGDIPKVTPGARLEVPARVASVDVCTPDRVRSLARMLASIAQSPPTEAIQEAAAWLRAHRTDRAASAPAIEAASQALLNLSGSLPERVRYVRRPRAEDHESGGVTLATFHGSKGLEFHSVVCCGLIEGAVPSRKAESVEEERRLLYVAMTRAESELVLSFPLEVVSADSARRVQATPSRFLTMDLGIELTPSEPATDCRTADSVHQ
jgi:superfamily I DNA/RNA helicase